MKADAYSFARAVDHHLEMEERDPYILHRAKKLREELYPISRLALSFKQAGTQVEVEAFEDSRPRDGHIRVTGFNPKAFDVEVTAVYSHEHALRDEMLVKEGSAPGAGSIRRGPGKQGYVAEMGIVDIPTRYVPLAKDIVERLRMKHEKRYASGTVLIIAFYDHPELFGRSHWADLFDAIDAEGGLESDVFGGVYLFNDATGQIRIASGQMRRLRQD